MAVDERTRHEMYLGLEERLGPKVADALMQHLPSIGWAEVATKRDVDMLAATTRHEIDGLHQKIDRLDQKIDRLDQKIDGLDRKVDREVGSLRESTARELAGMEERLGLLIESRLQRTANRLMLWLFPTLLTTLGLVFAVAKLA